MEKSLIFCLIFLLFHFAWSNENFNNQCLLKDLNRPNIPSKDFDCPEFVIRSTDEIWNGNSSEEYIVEKLSQYMDLNWESVTVYGEYLHGFQTLIDLVLNTRRAFPDLKLYISDVFCHGNDVDGYKTTMPVLHEGTHTGYHPNFGAPTGKVVRYAGIPNCFIKKFPDGWKYTSEWNMFDAWSLYAQLQTDPPHPKVSPIVIDKCQQIFDWDTGKLNQKLIPRPRNEEDQFKDMIYRFNSNRITKFNHKYQRL